MVLKQNEVVNFLKNEEINKFMRGSLWVRKVRAVKFDSCSVSPNHKVDKQGIINRGDEAKCEERVVRGRAEGEEPGEKCPRRHFRSGRERPAREMVRSAKFKTENGRIHDAIFQYLLQ